MVASFHILASGSSGNASVLRSRGFGVLIDFGLSPRQLAPRMARCGITWDDIDAVVLTHPHSDHWQPTTLAQIARLKLPIYSHPAHLPFLAPESRAHRSLRDAGLFRTYEPESPIVLQQEISCIPVALSHDGAMTCGFRFDGADWSLAYLVDLGCWTIPLAQKMADVDLLALEFNHDVGMQLASGRHPSLIRRVIGDSGHLSNEQAASLLKEIIRRSTPGRVRHVVQMHLSRQCNTTERAFTAGSRVVQELDLDLSILTAHQDLPGVSVEFGRGHGTKLRERMTNNYTQATLPFAE